MSSTSCNQSAQVSAYVMQALPPDEAVAIEVHIASCAQCRQELEALRPVADSFVGWPTDILRCCHRPSTGTNPHGRKSRRESSAS